MMLLVVFSTGASAHYEPLLQHQKGRGWVDGITTDKQAHLNR